MTTIAPARLLADALARDPGRPLVTFYDDATGERTELSVATFDNWVAKTANFMVDGLGLGAGSRVALLLPLHWQTAVWLAACWSVGATAVLATGTDETGSPSLSDIATEAELAVCEPATLDAALAADEVVALSLRPLAGRFLAPLPGGVLDYAVEVPGYGDRFAANVADTAVATTEVGGIAFTGTGLLDAAADAADRWSLESGGRLLTTRAPDTLDGLLALLPAALTVGGSVVLCRNTAATEHAANADSTDSTDNAANAANADSTANAANAANAASTASTDEHGVLAHRRSVEQVTATVG